MGRPLNKKFFGNRNPGLDGDFGAQNTAGDAGLTGTGIDRVEISYEGDGWTTQPTYVVEAPSMANGTTLQVLPHYQAQLAATVTNGKGYNYNDTFALLGTYGPNGHGNGQPGYANATVSAITAVGVTANPAWDGVNGYADGDELVFSAGMVSGHPICVTVKRRTGDPITGTVIAGLGAPTGFLITDGGARAAAAPANPFAYDTNGLGGQGAVLSFVWGVYSVDVADPGTETGDYTTFPTNPVTAYGTATEFFTPATFTLTSVLRSIAVVNPGNGYVPVQFTPDPEYAYAVPFGPLINFTPDRSVSYDTYGHASRSDISGVDRGIFVYGYNPITGYGDVPFVPVDVIKQVSSRRYRIRERQFAYLGATEYGTLTATDTHGSFSIGTAQPDGTFAVGSYVAIYGTPGGPGAIAGYYTGRRYEIVATNGTSTFKLKDFEEDLTTTAGAITGLTIISQEAPSRPLIVRSAKLVPYWPENTDEIAILAMDNTSSLYFVTKLTARRVQLVRTDLGFFNNNWRFEDGQSAPWTMDVDKLDTAHGTNVWIQNFDILTGP